MGVSMHVQGPLSGAFLSISLAALNRKYFTMGHTIRTACEVASLLPGSRFRLRFFCDLPVPAYAMTQS
jgi:hypothetical protein